MTSVHIASTGQNRVAQSKIPARRGPPSAVMEIERLEPFPQWEAREFYWLLTKTSAGSLKRLLNFRTCSSRW